MFERREYEVLKEDRDELSDILFGLSEDTGNREDLFNRVTELDRKILEYNASKKRWQKRIKYVSGVIDEHHIDHTAKYGKLNLLVMKYGVLAGVVDQLLITHINDALDRGGWHRCGDTVFFSYHESWGVVSVVADPDQDSLFSVVTGMCLSDWFRGKRVDRDTAVRIAKSCGY
jgi:hypothetical protein